MLTDSEIEAAQGIIIAADKNVEMARFDGKPVLSVKVSDGIHKPEELIQKSKTAKRRFITIPVKKRKNPPAKKNRSAAAFIKI